MTPVASVAVAVAVAVVVALAVAVALAVVADTVVAVVFVGLFPSGAAVLVTLAGVTVVFSAAVSAQTL